MIFIFSPGFSQYLMLSVLARNDGGWIETYVTLIWKWFDLFFFLSQSDCINHCLVVDFKSLWLLPRIICARCIVFLEPVSFGDHLLSRMGWLNNTNAPGYVNFYWRLLLGSVAVDWAALLNKELGRKGTLSIFYPLSRVIYWYGRGICF